jgi:hypothetical protein
VETPSGCSSKALGLTTNTGVGVGAAVVWAGGAFVGDCLARFRFLPPTVLVAVVVVVVMLKSTPEGAKGEAPILSGMPTLPLLPPTAAFLADAGAGGCARGGVDEGDTLLVWAAAGPPLALLC